MKIEGKYLFGSVGILGLVGLQGAAWFMGYDGQILTFTTAGISALLTFLLGLNLPSPAEKKAVNDFITSYINAEKPKT